MRFEGEIESPSLVVCKRPGCTHRLVAIRTNIDGRFLTGHNADDGLARSICVIADSVVKYLSSRNRQFRVPRLHSDGESQCVTSGVGCRCYGR